MPHGKNVILICTKTLFKHFNHEFSGTAKKFLAAANFLEVLSIVSTSMPATIDIPEKIRYAKWKAADIAKAFREGRKPTPGGIGEQLEQKEKEPEENPKVELSPPPAIQRLSPPGPIVDIPQSPPALHTLPSGFADPKAGPLSPEEWSTVATTGATTQTEDLHSQPKSVLRNACVSEELEDTEPGLVPDESGMHEGVGPADISARPYISPASSDSSSKKVHFTPSVIGGLTPSTTVAEQDPLASATTPILAHDKPIIMEAVPSAPPFETESTLPKGFLPTSTAAQSLPSTTLPPPPFPVLAYPTTSQSQVSIPPAIIPPPGVTDSTVTQTPQELTPQTVARIQKHCRYAISALDYEDVEQARKELRAALDKLGW
jgi:vacuolar protein sorting-associated protein VTA1